MARRGAAGKLIDIVMGLFQSTDDRLLGTWRCNREMTLREWIYSETTDEKDKERIAAWFGKLRITYTRNKIFTELDGDKTVCPYRVAAKDKESVAIICKADRENEIRHIRFLDSNSYWITAGRNREFFVRVST